MTIADRESFRSLWAAYREASFHLGLAHTYVATWRTAVRAAVQGERARRPARAFAPMFR